MTKQDCERAARELGDLVNKTLFIDWRSTEAPLQEPMWWARLYLMTGPDINNDFVRWVSPSLSMKAFCGWIQAAIAGVLLLRED